MSGDLKEQIELVAERYATRRSAIMPALYLIQEQRDHLSGDELKEVADILDVPEIWVYELATFYTMFHTEPVGTFHIQLCTNVSCMLRRAGDLLDYMERRLQIKNGETTSDGRFTLSTVECFGSCDKAPAIMVNQVYYENLDEDQISDILDQLTDSGGN